jgi:glycine oxidase
LSQVPRGDESPGAELYRVSHEIYPGLVEALTSESGVDPEATWPGHLIPAQSYDDAEQLRSGVVMEQRQGHATEFVEGKAVREIEPALGPSVLAAALRPGGQIDNRRLCRALEVANRRSGVDLRFGAAVSEVLHQGGRVAGVRSLDGDYHAPVVVNAAGSWSGQLRGCDPAMPVAPQRGEILALDQSAVGLRRVVLKPNDPYLVPRTDGRLIVGATRKYVGYDSSFTAGGLSWLLDEAIGLVPALAEATVHELWTGFRPNSADGLPMIGRGAVEGLFFATGHGPSGIAPAPASARLLAALVTGEAPPVSPEPFDPMRFADWHGPRDARSWGVRGGYRV